jgi:hypothetical protein
MESFKVTIQRTAGADPLGIPRERQEAIGQEIAQTALTDPHWSQQPSYTVALAYQCAPTPNRRSGQWKRTTPM